MRNLYSKNPSVFWIVLAFIVWCITFFGFLSSKLAVFEDATSYLEHTKFYIENLARGVLPLWDPFWFNGAPNDFFLRRIGAFNPFYLFIAFLEFLHIPYTYAYLAFLALYFWGGMIAFYLLAMRLYQNRLIAYAGYLMLMFSALGTRLFDSYMMLVTVPIIWFFYFLVAFSQTPAKHFFLGMCLSLMILIGTYIPFYFLSFLMLFVLVFAAFYFKQLPVLAKRYLEFVGENKLLVILCLLLVLFSFAPLYSFFHNSTNGQIAMPVRHGSSALNQPLVVAAKTIDWGAVEDIVFSAYFSDLRTYRFAIIYVPFFAVLVFMLGLFGRISRLSAFLFVTAAILFACIIPHGLPFYNFLHQHVFFLKYFRNLHFFLWFVLIPLFVVLVLEHWKMLAEMKLGRKALLAYVGLVHGVVLIFVYIRGDAIVSTYVMLILSVIFWTLKIQGRLTHQAWAMALVSLVIIVQPLEVYYYLSLRAVPFKKGIYDYQFSYNHMPLLKAAPVASSYAGPKQALYYAASSYNNLYEQTSSFALASYLQSKFDLVDHVQAIDASQVDFKAVEQLFINNENKAFVFAKNAAGLKTDSDDAQASMQAKRIVREDESFKVLAFHANAVKIALQLPQAKFLVYKDSYDPYWRVWINGKPAEIYQTNIAFKGVWVPAGKNIVEFRYGQWWQYAMNWILLLGAFALLIGIICFSYRTFRGYRD